MPEEIGFACIGMVLCEKGTCNLYCGKCPKVVHHEPNHTCYKDDGGTPNRRCLACEIETARAEELKRRYVEPAAARMAEDFQLRTRAGDQPLPIKNNYPVVQDMVMRDIEERKKLGIARYGTTLQPFNGRDVLKDIYEELLDAAIYMRQLMYERDIK